MLKFNWLQSFCQLQLFETLYKYFVKHESFVLQLHSHLPYLPPTNWIFFLINFIHQGYLTLITCIFVTYCLSFLNACLVRFVVHLKALDIMVVNMGTGIVEGSFQQWLKNVSMEFYDAKKWEFLHEKNTIILCYKFFLFFLVTLVYWPRIFLSILVLFGKGCRWCLCFILVSSENR